MEELLYGKRLVLNKNNSWVRVVLRLNKFGADANLFSLLILCTVLLIDIRLLTILCIIIVFALNISIKMEIITGVRKACSYFKVKHINPINSFDIASFILGYMAIIIVGISLPEQKTEIKLVVIVMVAMVVYITSIENIHKLWIEIRLQRKYDINKDIEFAFGEEAIAYDRNEEIVNDISKYNILCIEHNNYFKLFLYLDSMELRKKLLLVSNNDRNNIEIDNILTYKIITKISIISEGIIITADNIKDYL